MKFKAVILYFFYCNFHIGILSVLLGVEYCLLAHIHLPSTSYFLFIFSATTTYYNLSSYVLIRKNSFNTERIYWLFYHKKIFICTYYFLIASVLISLILVSELMIVSISTISSMTAIFLVLVLSSLIAYGGLVSKQLNAFNFRKKGFLKPIYIGFIWALVVCLFPILYQNHNNLSYNFLLTIFLFLQNWILCCLNALLFDIKDIGQDTKANLNTIPIYFGSQKTIIFFIFPLIFSGFIVNCLIKVAKDWNILVFLIYCLPLILYVLILNKLKQKRELIFYLIVVDGILIVKAIFGIINS